MGLRTSGRPPPVHHGDKPNTGKAEARAIALRMLPDGLTALLLAAALPQRIGERSRHPEERRREFARQVLEALCDEGLAVSRADGTYWPAAAVRRSA